MSRGGLSCGVDVCVDIPGDADRPECIHGPTLLFTRYYADKNPRQFYACSACRDRKHCAFFQWADEKASEEKQRVRQQINAMQLQQQQQQLNTSDEKYLAKLETFKELSSDKQRRFCISCSEVLLPGEWSKHSAHHVKTNVTQQQLTTPTRLLRPLEDEKTHAQYLFTNETTQFLVEVFRKLRISKVVCIGTPRIHEHIMECKNLKSFLLDIDHRYAQFFSPDTYQRFNMFNSHFFNGDEGKTHFKEFLTSGSSNLAFILDPPFGGIAEVLACTLKSLWSLTASCNAETVEREYPTFWIFPYFLEGHVTDALPMFKMLDYKVNYDNHVLYKCSKKRGSPVRLFTNVSSEKVKLPASEGYRLCRICRRYVAKENKHCVECNSCTSKDGRTYVHCSQCKTCVKPGRVHCDTCSHCQPPVHECTHVTPLSGCHICGQLDHKRKDCPRRLSNLQRPAKRKSDHSDSHQSPKKKKSTVKKSHKVRKLKAKAKFNKSNRL